MKYVYASRTGNVESIVTNLGLDALRIEDGTESIDDDFVLFTYTDGAGDVPPEVSDFLSSNGSHIKGVVASGDADTFGEDLFCLSADKISEEYGCPILAKVQLDGTEEDMETIKAALASL